MRMLAVFAVGLAAMVVPALAHHSFAAEYDNKNQVTLTGTVTQVDWLNPHVRFYFDVKDDTGKVTNWQFELGSPNVLVRKGWSRNSLKVGDVVTVHGSLAKDGTHVLGGEGSGADAQTVRLADGRRLFAGSADDSSTTK
jgi:hypothetical protein